MKFKIVIKIICVSIFLIVSACNFSGKDGSNSPQITPELMVTSPDIQGVITKVYISNQDLDGFFVENTYENARYSNAYVGITAETQIFIQIDNTYTITTAEAIEVNEVVAILLADPVLTSDPIQANALEIVIIK